MFGHYIDLAKDVILASRLAGILGGITTVFLLYDRFSSMVSFYDSLTARKFFDILILLMLKKGCYSSDWHYHISSIYCWTSLMYSIPNFDFWSDNK